MVGVNEFATSVWGLRKIMPSYMKKAYGGVSQEILNILGFKKLLGVKHVELWGFDDYFTQSAIYCIGKTPWLVINNVPPSPGFLRGLEGINDPARRQTIFAEAKKVFNSPLITLGGAICSLNQAAWSYTRRLGDIGKWFKGYVNLETEYVRWAWERLGAAEWVVPEYLQYLRNSRRHNLISQDLEFVNGFVYNENGVIEREVTRGSRDYCKCEYVKPYGVTLLARIIYDLAPAMLLGVSDITHKLRLHGSSSYNLCEDLAHSSGNVLSHEDINAVVVFFREV
jgi:predicted metalloprotease